MGEEMIGQVNSLFKITGLLRGVATGAVHNPQVIDFTPPKSA